MKTALLVIWLLVLLQVSYRGYAQSPLASYQLDSLPSRGVLLNQGWWFRDNPAWSTPALNDSHWLPIDPTMNKTLYRKLQAKLQLTPHELVRTYRPQRSSDLLRQGKSATETAYSVGFDNVNYFGQCFKEQYQVTPGEFINQMGMR